MFLSQEREGGGLPVGVQSRVRGSPWLASSEGGRDTAGGTGGGGRGGGEKSLLMVNQRHAVYTYHGTSSEWCHAVCTTHTKLSTGWRPILATRTIAQR